MLYISTKLIRSRLQLATGAFALGNRTPFIIQRGKQLANMGTKTDITLYTASTPNGIKVPILLAELGLEYKVRGNTILYNG